MDTSPAVTAAKTENITEPATSNVQSSTPTDIAISVQNISKMYPLYAKPNDRLKQSLWYALPKFLRGKPREFYREFWSLRNISFEIKKGETVGIIGRNGAGKSTLLQIIAGILTPSEGEVHVRGQVAALLELSSGFNPEFTGRENVYLKGAILGFSRQEMEERFNEIANFADIGEFIDQPVRFYSSGMLARLAFAVASHINPDILIVDEAISVGDVQFQRRCVNRMKQLCDGGSTVLLVSHNLHLVERFSSRVIVLEKGHCMINGDTSTGVSYYHDMVLKKEETVTQSDQSVPMTPETRFATGEVELVKLEFFNSHNQTTNIFFTGDDIHLVLTYKAHQPIQNFHFGISIWTQDEIRVGQATTIFNSSSSINSTLNGEFVVHCEIPSVKLLPGRYYLRGGVLDENLHFPLCLWGWTGETKGEFFIASKPVNGFILKSSLGFVIIPSKWWLENSS